MNTRWMGLILLGLLAGAGCRASNTEDATPDARDASAASEAPMRNTLRVPPEMQQKWGIEVARAARAAVAGTMTIPGTLSLDPRRTAQISSLLDGRVTFVGVQVGDEVRRDDVLVRLQAPALAQAKTVFLQAGSKLDLARQDFDRAEVLLRQEAIDRKEHQRRKSELDSASSEFDVAESNLHAYGLDQAAVDRLRHEARGRLEESAPADHVTEPTLTLTAPIAGRVITLDVINGQHVEPQQALLTVSDLSTLWAILDARERDLPHVTRGREVRITTGIFPDRSWTGTVDHVGDVVDEKTRTVRTRVVVRNEGRLLKPNMYIQGEIVNVSAARDTLTVPQDAIQTLGGESIVFVREGGDVFVAQPVELGEKIGIRRAVVQGLDESDMVVVAGAFNLKAELLKSTLGGE